jgi:hypothetical protein
MRIEPELGGCSIVLVGHFNPLIFSPAWFARNGIVSDAEADSAVVGIIHPDIANFNLGKIQIQVERTRFNAETAEAPWVALCDFVIKTFAEFLVHTPINQMGINRTVHFSVGSETTRNKIGHTLAPLGPWGRWGQEMMASDTTARAGFSNITMLQPKIVNKEITGHHQAQVQPSTHLRGNAGIFMNVNDHYSFKDLQSTVGCEEVMASLSENFDGSIKNSEEIIDQIMSLKDSQS